MKSNLTLTLDRLREINHKEIFVHELINLLAQQSPMMPILAYNEDKGEPNYLNGIRVDDSGDRPVFILYFSEFPKANADLYADCSHEEKVALQKQKAFDMERESQGHMQWRPRA